MIEIPLVTLLLLYMAGLAGLAIVLILVSQIRWKWKKWQTMRHLVFCPHCHLTYLDKKEADLCRCPACGRLNDRHRGLPPHQA
jgi:protein-arginine kinase activator protein McsA